MLKTIRVDMKTKEIRTEEFDTSILFGNRGLIDKILIEEVDPKCDPLGPDNKLIFATGIFAGYGFPTGNRLSVGTKSPLTKTIKESNVGGTAATNFSMHGIKMLIIENAPSDDRWYMLRIAANGDVSLEPAEEYLSKGTYEVNERLKDKYGGKQTSVCLIGQGGERMYKVASIQVSDFSTGHPSRAAGRGGTGAVMGSKHLKAILIEKPEQKAELPMTDEKKVKEIIKGLYQANKEFPKAKMNRKKGTYGNSEFTIPTNSYPLKNFNGAAMTDEQIQKINSASYEKRMNSFGGKQGVPCQAGCPVGCSNIYNDENGELVTSGLEYETIALCGPNCDIYDWDYIAEFDRICDDVGVDTIDIADAIAVAMDAGYIPWGDIETSRKILNEMKKGEGFGNILGNGTQAVGDYFKFDRVPTCKNQSFPAYDPRAFKGMGVTYATFTQGADHTGGPTLSIPDLDHSDPDLQKEASKKMQLTLAMVDNICCIINSSVVLSPETAPLIPELITAIYGVAADLETLDRMGTKTYEYEVKFNEKAGALKNTIPEFLKTQKTQKTEQVFDVKQKDLDTIWEIRQ